LVNPILRIAPTILKQNTTRLSALETQDIDQAMQDRACDIQSQKESYDGVLMKS
jgi:hypothetical protein